MGVSTYTTRGKKPMCAVVPRNKIQRGARRTANMFQFKNSATAVNGYVGIGMWFFNNTDIGCFIFFFVRVYLHLQTTCVQIFLPIYIHLYLCL